MITNPYQVLGVSQNASNDEIKKAYRELSRKYHPDSYADNPLAGLAEEKFKEVQEAYDQIMKERESGSGYSWSNNAGEDSQELAPVYNYLNSRRYNEALNALSMIQHRSARWYYYSAIANAGLGNSIVAADHAGQAVNMEPDNADYRNLLNQLEWQSKRYQDTRYNNTGYGYGGGYNGGYGRNNSSCGTGNLCCDLWCADSLCECMGGDLCSCF